jgi:hypothetical protein
VTNLLAVALVMLTAVQILHANIWFSGRPLILAVVLSILSWMAMWMLGKMLYWAALASAILYVDEHDVDDNEEPLAPNIAGLHNGACCRVKRLTKFWFTKLSTHFESLSWKHGGPWLALLLAVIVFAAVMLLLPTGLP